MKRPREAPIASVSDFPKSFQKHRLSRLVELTSYRRAWSDPRRPRSGRSAFIRGHSAVGGSQQSIPFAAPQRLLLRGYAAGVAETVSMLAIRRSQLRIIFTNARAMSGSNSVPARSSMYESALSDSHASR